MDPPSNMKRSRKRRKRSKGRSEGASSRNEESAAHDAESHADSIIAASSSPNLHLSRKQTLCQSKARPSLLSDEKGKHGRKRPRLEGGPERQERPSTSSATIASCPQHPFEVDATDHCETPLEAYCDVADLLDQIAKSLGKTRRDLSIYDPYYCNGGVTVKLNSLGFGYVRNDNADFYKAIENGTVPKFDVLVTNPPYSGIHLEKLLSFVATSRKPFLLLLPHYVYTKDYYQRALGSKVKPFFLVPKKRYSYVPPLWVQNGSTALAKGKITTSPFPSFWYCHANHVSTKWLTQTYGTSGVYRHDFKIQYANCAAHIPRDMKGEFDKNKKRPNARSRKRNAAKKGAVIVGMP